MPTPVEMSCEVHRIVAPIWERVSQDSRNTIAQLLSNWTEFDGSVGNRKGFSGVIRAGDFVVGFYLQEDYREGLDGDSPTTMRPKQERNFERLFFALVLDVGHLIIQTTRLSGYVSMNYPTMRRDFLDLLAQVFRNAGVSVRTIGLEKYYRRREQTEMRRFFLENPTNEIEVVGLNGKTVPDTIQLSNPDPSEELMLKRIFNRDYQVLDEEILRAADGKDLRQTKAAKAATHAGHIKRLTIQAGNNDKEEILEVQDEKLRVPIDASNDVVSREDLEGVIEIYERRIRIPTNSQLGRQLTQEPESFGPLFEQHFNEHKNE